VKATASFFRNPRAGDLHLLPTADDAIDKGVRPIEWPRDWDGELRPTGTRPDIGADESPLSARRDEDGDVARVFEPAAEPRAARVP
jgi:hypothetical protein